MVLDEIYQKLKTVGIPLSYHHFQAPVKPPYMTYYENGAVFNGSDFQNDVIVYSIVVELYSDRKDTKLEEKLEEVLGFTHFEKEMVFIHEEKIYETIYTFDVIEKRG